jgi:hypothetical protein
MNLGYVEADRTPSFTSDVDGFTIQGYVWEIPAPKAVVVIAHGAAEHSLRYGRFARALNAAGYETWSLTIAMIRPVPRAGHSRRRSRSGYQAVHRACRQHVNLPCSSHNMGWQRRNSSPRWVSTIDEPCFRFEFGMGGAAGEKAELRV